MRQVIDLTGQTEMRFDDASGVQLYQPKQGEKMVIVGPSNWAIKDEYFEKVYGSSYKPRIQK